MYYVRFLVYNPAARGLELPIPIFPSFFKETSLEREGRRSEMGTETIQYTSAPQIWKPNDGSSLLNENCAN